MNLQEISTKREFGNEKNKLVLQPLGLITIEFLVKHFQDIFDYDYTKGMEDRLMKWRSDRSRRNWRTLNDLEDNAYDKDAMNRCIKLMNTIRI